MARGGYQKPSRPAPVSGPGAMSRRTDGQTPRSPGGMPYGENSDFLDLQSSAPMAESRAPQTQGQRATTQPGASLPTPFTAPTERPDEPLTEGNPLGPGAGPGVLTNPSFEAVTSRDMQNLKQYLPDLEVALTFRNAPDSFRSLVNYLRNS